LQGSKEAKTMKPEEIKRGKFYRFRGSNTVFGMLSEWVATAELGRELEYIAIHHNGMSNETKRQSAEQIAAWCPCEVEPTWVDVKQPPVADERQTEITSEPEGQTLAQRFMQSMLNGTS
jgi:hypothetical protein